MKAQRWINILVVIQLVLLTVLRCVRLEQRMAINFDNADGTSIDFGSISAVNSTTQITVVAIVDRTTAKAGARYIVGNFNNDNSAGFTFAVRDDAGGTTHTELNFWAAVPTGNDGHWQTNNDTIIENTKYGIAVTYDSASDANDPIIYINGVSVAITETQAPAAAISLNGGELIVGNFKFSDALVKSFDGIIRDIRIYNRILTAGEILDLYNSKGASHNDYGLVFHLPMNGAAGVQTFGGAALGSTNYVYDRISGIKGTPSGSPVGVADTILTFVDDH